MNEPRLDDAAKTLATASRRRTLRAAGAVLAVGLARLCPAPARAGHFGCQHLGARCADATQCCSGICKRKRGTNCKTCRAHGKGICKAGQDSCAQPGAYPCGSNFGSPCHCFVTTGQAPLRRQERLRRLDSRY